MIFPLSFSVFSFYSLNCGSAGRWCVVGEVGGGKGDMVFFGRSTNDIAYQMYHLV